MPAVHVSEEIVVNKPVSEVYAYVRDFKKWPEWSPWFICEPETHLEFQQDSYTWEGKIIGSGQMSVAEAKENEQIFYKLEFFKPWKSKADVRMEFSGTGDETRVRWVMDSSLPWFMFFLKAMMECMVGMDYQRGLRMLKEKLETGTVLSELDYDERVSIPACDYIGIERSCSMAEMETVMIKDFEKLASIYADQGKHDEPMFTIYNKWKLSKGEVNYIACCPVGEIPSQLADGMVSGNRPACEVFAVIHKGSYQHLGNAWSSAMMRARAKLFKQSKVVFPFEQYISDPKETPEAEILTRICLARKD